MARNQMTFLQLAKGLLSSILALFLLTHYGEVLATSMNPIASTLKCSVIEKSNITGQQLKNSIDVSIIWLGNKEKSLVDAKIKINSSIPFNVDGWLGDVSEDEFEVNSTAEKFRSINDPYLKKSVFFYETNRVKFSNDMSRISYQRKLIGTEGTSAVLIDISGSCQKITGGQLTHKSTASESSANFSFIVPPIYGNAQEFSDGLGAVSVGDFPSERWGFIDRSGKIVIKPQYAATLSFRNGYAAVQFGNTDGKWGFIDKNGNIAIEPIYEKVSSFYEDLAAVSVDGTTWGYINLKGVMVIPPHFVNAGNFSEGYAAAERLYENGYMWGFVDKSGSHYWVGVPKDLSLKIRKEAESQYVPGNLKGSWFSDGLASVSAWDKGASKLKFGYIDRSGLIKIYPRYNFGANFSEGLAAVGVDEEYIRKYGFIDTKGNLIVAAKYDEVNGDFREGLAGVKVGQGKSGKWGFIDTKGNLVIGVDYDNVGDFREGVAIVNLYSDLKPPIAINRLGEIIIGPQFSIFGDFSNGVAYAGFGKLFEKKRVGFIAKIK